ncbi:MAG: hypothetical protein ACRYG6_00795 [Janthinobacterium lividum]
MHRYLSTGPSTIAALMAARHAAPATPRDTLLLTTLLPDLARPRGHARHAPRAMPQAAPAPQPRRP